MSEDLRPCPFCGSDDVKHALPGDDHEFIICNDCGADMDRVNCQDDPVPAWNRRAGQQGEARPARAEKSAQLVERLAELMRGLEIPAAAAAFSPKQFYILGAGIAAQAKRAPDAPAASGERDTLRALLREVFDAMDEGDGQAPGHGHSVRGRWDDTGAPCTWCATWVKVRAALADGGATHE